MTPRVAGILLMIGSAALGVLAGTLFAVPWWQIPAALMLTVATVGMTVGLLWLFRKGWEDKTWPPGGSSREPNARRSAFRLGIVLLALSPALLAYCVWMTVQGLDTPLAVRVGVMSVAYIVFGILLIRFGRRPILAATDEDAPTEESLDDLPADADGWRALGRRDWTLALTVIVPVAFYVLVYPFGFDSVLWFAFAGVAIAGATVAGLLFARSRMNVVWVHVDDRRVRIGRRVFDWDDIVSAQLTASSALDDAPRTLVLMLRGPAKTRVPVVIRRKDGSRPGGGELALAMRMIEASRIEIPIAPEDPRGKFAHINFPGYVDKELALDLVRNPPRSGEPLPVPLV